MFIRTQSSCGLAPLVADLTSVCDYSGCREGWLDPKAATLRRDQRKLFEACGFGSASVSARGGHGLMGSAGRSGCKEPWQTKTAEAREDMRTSRYISVAAPCSANCDRPLRAKPEFAPTLPVLSC